MMRHFCKKYRAPKAAPPRWTETATFDSVGPNSWNESWATWNNTKSQIGTGSTKKTKMMQAIKSQATRLGYGRLFVLSFGYAPNGMCLNATCHQNHSLIALMQLLSLLRDVRGDEKRGSFETFIHVIADPWINDALLLASRLVKVKFDWFVAVLFSDKDIRRFRDQVKPEVILQVAGLKLSAWKTNERYESPVPL